MLIGARLIKRLDDQDVQVASAAALALGRIGDEPVRKFCWRKTCQRHRCRAIRRSRRFYHVRRETSQSKPRWKPQKFMTKCVWLKSRNRVLEATRGAILARTGDAVPLLMEQINSSDKALQRLGLTVARELKVNGVTEA